ncbi:hypothetical protein NKH48_17655 [Mesorhizobium sp. M1233]|uniref:hypothetical protein n=1 Tax=unclassified Mesorhizobium TaxID=325217 RepID=UPI00333DEC71
MNWRIGVYGAFGGVAAPLLTMAQNLESGGPNVPSVLAWLGGVLILALLGGVIAVASREVAPFRAVVLGLSLPATISSLAKNNQILQEQLANPGASTKVGLSFISPAAAQQGRTMTIKDLPSGNPGMSIIFYDANGMPITPTITSPTSGQSLPVPEKAVAVVALGADGRSLPQRLPQRSFKLDVEERSQFIRGFKAAFGADANRYEININ